MIPFFKTVAVFFVLFGESSSDTFFCCVLKCLPILALIHFVLLDGVNMTDAYSYTRKICIGLMFSAIGDALLGECSVTVGVGTLGYMLSKEVKCFEFNCSF